MFNLITLPLIIIIVLVSLSLATNTKIFSISSSSTLYTPLPASAFIGMTSSAAATTTTGGYSFLTYSDPILGIKIEYPAGWTQELEGAGLVTFTANLESGDLNTYPAAVGIKVQNLVSSKNISLNEITKIQIKDLKQSHPDFKLIESTESMLAGNNMAHKIVFTATDDSEHQRKAMQIWTLKGDKVYLITYKAEPEMYSKYLPTIQKMIDSFQIIK
jgi:eukaryotic-like serine/threonine-protein kinase